MPGGQVFANVPIRRVAVLVICQPVSRDLLTAASCSETWAAMEELHALGLAKAIGVSNFSCALVMDLLKTCRGGVASHMRVVVWLKPALQSLPL